MAFGDIYKTAWRDTRGRQVTILEGGSSSRPCYAMVFGEHDMPCPFRSLTGDQPKTLNHARALTAMTARGCGWHVDMTLDVGLYDKDGNLLPDPDEVSDGLAMHSGE